MGQGQLCKQAREVGSMLHSLQVKHPTVLCAHDWGARRGLDVLIAALLPSARFTDFTIHCRNPTLVGGERLPIKRTSIVPSVCSSARVPDGTACTQSDRIGPGEV